MAIPNVSGALRGWVTPRYCFIVTKSVVDFQAVQVAEVVTMRMMVQPLQPEKVRRKPEEQRAWKWYSILVDKRERELGIDTRVIVGGTTYRIDSRQDWAEAGYRRYEATEDYTGYGPLYAINYGGNGADAGELPKVFAYEDGQQVPAAVPGTLSREGYTFTAWNTAADGTGTEYEPGDMITIAAADVMLFAQWEEVTP